MKQLMINAIAVGTMLCLAQTCAADSGDEFTVKKTTAVEESKAPGKNAEKPQKVKKPRKCWKCHGKGAVLQTVRETCDRCEGTGVLVTEVTLQNKLYGHDWGGKEKKSTSKKSCPRCNRTGSVAVKKEVECTYCKGTGEL